MKAMKITLAALLSLALVGPAAAQEPALPPNTFIEVQPEDNYLAKDVLIGAKVQNSEGKIIGDIEDVILNDWNRVQGVIVGTGGFLGLAEKRIGIQLGALEFQEKDGKRVVVLPGVTKEMLQQAKAFERKEPKRSLLERAMDKARELTDKSAETARETYEKAKEQAGPAYEKAKEAAGQAYEKAKEAATEAYQKAREAASPPAEPKQQ